MRTARRRLALEELFRRSMLDGAAIRDARRRMAAPGRHYHGLDHIAYLWIQHRRLSRGTMFRTRRAERLIATTIIFHDAILDPRRSDNEAASARLWRRRARTEGTVPRGLIERVASIIEATAGHTTVRSGGSFGDLAMQWMLDLDLAPIGAPPYRFRSNSSALRAEFGFMAAAEWERRTRDFLHALEQRRPLYYSRRARLAFAAAARANLAWELRTDQLAIAIRSSVPVTPATTRSGHRARALRGR